jgi:tRNA(Leu) C34 or U34 (ribose-2'-O)-methylase TrmL
MMILCLRKWILFSTLAILAILNALLPSMALAESGFAVGPAQLDITIPETGTAQTYVYITSYLEGELVVGTENLSFRIEPSTIAVTSTDRNRKVELVVHGNTSLAAGQYSGKLTFLLFTGGDVAYGVKINTNITQLAGSEPKGILDEIVGIIRQNCIVIIVVAGVAVALGLGIFLSKKSKRAHASRVGRRTFVTAFTCLFAILLVTMPVEAQFEHGEAVPLWGPYLTMASETCITVNWRTESATSGGVYYATKDYFDRHGIYNQFLNDSETQLHHVQLTQLAPDTTYHYRVLIGEEVTADHTFTTFGSYTFTFVVYGDTQEQLPMFTQLERHKIVADRIAAENGISFILHCGDLVGDVNSPEEWNRFFEAARSALAKTPIFPVLGNHENNSSDYYDAFGIPQWYSFDCGNAHFAMLDSNSLTAIQAKWLTEDLSGDACWKFAVFHHPPYSSANYHWGGWLDLRAAWEPVFVANGVNAVFNGHVHAYERYCENGIHYAVLGIGGGPCYMLAEEKMDGYRNSFENTLGYARVTVNGNKAFMEIIKVADVSGSEVTYIYPPNTVFERVDLSPESLWSNVSLMATTNLTMPMVGIKLDRDSIDYGDIAPGKSSEVEAVGITNIGTVDVDVKLEINAADSTAQSFYEQSLYIGGSLYNITNVIASIEAGLSKDVNTQLHVPVSWIELGAQDATFIFWAEAS